MRKLVVRFLMLLFVLGMSTTAWAGGLLNQLDEDQRREIMAALTANPKYNAQLTGMPSTTGSGFVYVSTDESEPFENTYEEGESNVKTNGLNISMRGMSEFQVYMYAWAKPAAGYYFSGWSFTPDGTDIHDMEEDGVRERLTRKYDVSTDSNEVAKYTIYGTFEPIRMTDYVITGSNSTDNSGECSQSVVIALYGEAEDIDAEDFKDPQVTKKAGTNGDWEVTKWDYDVTNSGKVTVKVKFTAPDDAPAEYAANLVLETQAGIRMNVYLNARTALSSDDDISLYDGKNYVKAIDWSELATEDLTGYTNPIVKLNSNYSSPVTITKDITLDLNGYSLSTLAVSDNTNVTLAYSPYGGEITGNVAIKRGSTFVLNGGTISGALTNNGTLEQNGATISGEISNYGGMTTTGGVHTGALTNYDGAALTINGGTFKTSGSPISNNGAALIKKGTITSTGSYAILTQAQGNTIIEKLAVISGAGSGMADLANDVGGSLEIKCGKFADPANLLTEGSTVIFTSAYFQTNGEGLKSSNNKPIWRNTSGAEFRDGYNFFAGDLASAQAAGVSVCHIGGTSYTSLEDALAFANTTNEHLTIVMDNDYTLPAGYYTLPENAILLIPRNDTQDSETEVVNRMYDLGSDLTDSAIKPSMHRRLIFESGVNMDVYGTIEVAGSQYSYGGVYTGAACGTHGLLQMNKGSHMTLQDRSVLRAWGFITGDIASADIQNHVPMGEIDARRGSTVHELFQMGDWGSAMNAGMGLILGTDLFPLNTYFIQNIEVPVKYHPGAILSTATTVREEGHGIQVMMSADDIKIIGVSSGEPAMFSMDEMADAENTWVRKWYDASTDQQVYDINSGAHVGQLIIPLVSSPLFPMVPGLLGVDVPKEMVPTEVVLNSSQYNLPLTNNFKLHLLSGELDFTQNTELLPGCEVEIDKEATVYISKNPNFNSGDLYVFDWQDWSDNAEGEFARLVSYTPLFNGQPTTRVVDDNEGIGSAKINVHGAFETRDGFVYTSEHGADIFSSVEDAGTFLFFTNDHKDYVSVSQKNGGVTFYPVKLKNDIVFAETEYAYVEAGAEAAEDDTYCYMDLDNTGGRWTKLMQRACFTVDEANPENEIYYIKSQEYVEVVVRRAELVEIFDADGDPFDEIWQMEGNSDHTFSDAAGAGRLFIMTRDCQWWEVEQKNNLYHCLHPSNDTYYYWDTNNKEANDGTYASVELDGNENPLDSIVVPCWKEKRFTITWKDYDGTILRTYEVPYGTMAEYMSTNPTRPADVDYTYDFTGWSPALGKVTSDVTYTATYEKKQIKYTIVFEQDGGMEIERHLLARDEVPVCENTPTRTGYILQWEPSIAAVTGNQTYMATWLPEPPETYTITFKNYNGDTLKKEDGTTPAIYTVLANTEPEYDGATPGKSGSDEYTYEFTGWKPAIAPATTNATYVAQFREEIKTFPVKFYFEDKDHQVGETQNVKVGQMPVIPSEACLQLTEDDENVYTLVWTPQIQTVLGNDNDYTYEYVASYTSTPKLYSLTLKSSLAGAATITGARADYLYNAAATITVIPNEDYTFSSWSDKVAVGTPDGEGKYTRVVKMEKDCVLVANFTYNGDDKVAIHWKPESGGDEDLLTTYPKKGTATTFTGATPTKAADDHYTYTFDGWSTVLNGKRDYKNDMTPKATESATYYAHFDSVVNTYTITFKNGDEVLQSSEVEYGTMPDYTGATPTKEATQAKTYSFNRWTPAIESVTGDATYTATFNEPNRAYTITWLNDNGGLIEQTVVEYGQTPSHANPSKASTEECTYSFNKWTPAIESVTGDATYTAQFNSTVNKYTITFKNGDEVLQSSEVEYGTMPTYSGSEPTKAEDEQYTYTFDGWYPEVTVVNGPATYQATFSSTVNDDMTVGIGTVKNLNENKTKEHLIISSNGLESGQLFLNGYELTVNEDAYFDLTLNASPRTWYAVAVPWNVNAVSGISELGGTHLILGTDFDLVYYDGATRAVEGPTTNCWKYVELDEDKIMHPGRLYMIYFAGSPETIRFTKVAGTGNPILNTELTVSTYGGSGMNDNWNGIANPSLFYAYLNAGVSEGQIYNAASRAYLPYTLNDHKLIVGQPVFVQVMSGKTVVANPNTFSDPSPAPRRVPSSVSPARFEVEISANGQMADRLIVATDDNKTEDTYVIGQDISKAGVSTLVTQMWVNRYNTQLCKNTMALENERVDYPLGITVQHAGEHTIYIASLQNDNMALYLTYNGEAIANLSEGEYELYLERGTTYGYGLRVSAKSPQVTTGVDEAVIDAQGETATKVLIDDQVFIIRGNRVYSIDGQLVK